MRVPLSAGLDAGEAGGSLGVLVTVSTVDADTDDAGLLAGVDAGLDDTAALLDTVDVSLTTTAAGCCFTV